MEQDKLVTAIFDAVRGADASPFERMTAVIRAGHIAQAYTNTKIAEQIFGSSTDRLNDNEEPNSAIASGSSG